MKLGLFSIVFLLAWLMTASLVPFPAQIVLPISSLIFSILAAKAGSKWYQM